MTDTSIADKKTAKIREERARKESITKEDILRLIEQGKITEARHNLIFHAFPSSFAEKVDAIVNRLNRDFQLANREKRKDFLIFLTKLTLDLSSFLPRWNLKNAKLHGEAIVSDSQVETLVARNRKVISSWSNLDRALAESLLKEWLNETIFRFKVEGLSEEGEAERQAARFVGNSISEYMGSMEASFKRSNLRKICELRALGETQTEIGNDHSTNLEYALWLGASFVTTNPQLVEIAWELNPEKWTPLVDKTIQDRYSLEELSGMMRRNRQEEIAEVVEEINTDITIEVVLENANLLRGIFLLSEGQKGLVCLQVNPLRHSDADVMIREALYAYSKLTERLGGVPNVVFKLPATKDGLEAAKELTARGIGVTITVSFSMFQALPFAEVIDEGQAIVSYIVTMNGRLATPVMNELKKLGEDHVRAGHWAGVAVAKKLYQKLYAAVGDGGRCYSSKKTKMIIASLRDYGGSFPDIAGLIGASVITVFPNIRRAFDAEEREINANSIAKPVGNEILEKLSRSELFRQAYFSSGDDENWRPVSLFSLEDEEKVLEYPPVKNTLGQFCEYRIKMGELVKDRISMLCLRL